MGALSLERGFRYPGQTGLQSLCTYSMSAHILSKYIGFNLQFNGQYLNFASIINRKHVFGRFRALGR